MILEQYFDVCCEYNQFNSIQKYSNKPKYSNKLTPIDMLCGSVMMS